MKIRELKEVLKDVSREGAKIDNYKWDDIKNNLSDKNSLCCNEPIIILGGKNQDIGVCSSCKKFAIDKKKQGRLSQNRSQSFKKIAADALYNFDEKSNNYSIKGKPARNEKL